MAHGNSNVVCQRIYINQLMYVLHHSHFSGDKTEARKISVAYRAYYLQILHNSEQKR